MMTLFTDAMSHLPRDQFAHAAFVPLPSHDLEARDALVRQHLGFAHAAHSRKRLIQTFHINTGRYRQRQTRKRSEEHTSELQSLAYLVCRLLLEKKKESDSTVA